MSKVNDRVKILVGYRAGAVPALTDSEALDRIQAMLQVPEWPGAEMLEWINEVVIKTGRSTETLEDYEDED